MKTRFNLENFKEKLRAIGTQAALGHPKAKLWAKANHVDNFKLAINPTCYSAIIDEVGRELDSKNMAVRDWFNDHIKEVDKISLTAGEEAYKLLT